MPRIQFTTTNAAKRASTDNSVKGYKKRLKENPDAAHQLADTVIKNTYRTLMTRGMKGWYLFCADEETREYFGSCHKWSVSISGWCNQLRFLSGRLKIGAPNPLWTVIFSFFQMPQQQP